MLKNKVIIITGASQGLGEALAYKVAALGATTLLLARSKSKLKEVKDKIIESGGQAEFFVCDIRDLLEVQQTIDQILKKYKEVAVLVNNAGIWADNTLEKKQPTLRKIALETNVLGQIQVTDCLLAHFKAQNSGYIFNVISTSGTIDSRASDNSFWQTYGATKWALAGYSKSLKDSLKDTKIKVTSFFPGGFDSSLYENAGRSDAHQQPWMMKVEDIAEIIVFALTRPADVLLEKIVVTKQM